uniref:Uncharacterized protein n=1 Tax=Anguilla anguilla TaxID=7936 RepID=A0A0E9X0Q5_ANGAN
MAVHNASIYGLGSWFVNELLYVFVILYKTKLRKNISKKKKKEIKLVIFVFWLYP